MEGKEVGKLMMLMFGFGFWTGWADKGGGNLTWQSSNPFGDDADDSLLLLWLLGLLSLLWVKYKRTPVDVTATNWYCLDSKGEVGFIEITLKLSLFNNSELGHISLATSPVLMSFGIMLYSSPLFPRWITYKKKRQRKWESFSIYIYIYMEIFY